MNEVFYAEVARILNTTTESAPFQYRKRTRWNNRTPGSGRFAGRGVVRVFGNQVHIALHTPSISRICESKEEALQELNALVTSGTTNP